MRNNRAGDNRRVAISRVSSVSKIKRLRIRSLSVDGVHKRGGEYIDRIAESY